MRLSADPYYGYGFRHGLFVRFYEQCLHWFVRNVRELKPMLEPVKGGEALVYGGMPFRVFENILEQGALPGAAPVEGGWRWPYEEGNTDVRAVEYAMWRESIIQSKSAPPDAEADEPDGMSALAADILAFSLADSTPLEAMQAIHGWQRRLRGRKGAG